MSPRDPSSQSSYQTFAVKHYHLDFGVDFTEKKLKCSITLTVTARQKECSTLVSIFNLFRLCFINSQLFKLYFVYTHLECSFSNAHSNLLIIAQTRYSLIQCVFMYQLNLFVCVCVQSLDTSDLTIHSVCNSANGESLKYDIISPEGAWGSVLNISLPQGAVPTV